MVSESSAAKERRRAELRDFLRTRRARITPGEVGLVTSGTRRTPGLRREEVALLAGVGVSWYTWLEQGRDINVSAEVLDAVGGALRLTEPERAHLFLLAGLRPPRPHEPVTATVGPELRRLLDTWAPHPAILRDRYWNLIGINAGTRAVFGYDDADHNCLVSFFTNARYRDLHTEWSAIAPEVVAAYRADAAHAPGDPVFERVIGELSRASVEFAELWARHDVAAPTQAVKAVHHPDVGDLIFDKTTLAVIDHQDWYLEFYNPRPGTGTAERLATLMRTRTLTRA
ncbi:helix-turn-helix domain-containing protein [Nocardia uniformis]|uniref:Helix-turn-helix domain-containing protein n=1 Tax=Nocardia uniformis TaxID=53432 RepID=A0A849CKS0_9NOCA|nr:helix-turn-helix transcriptional regulator [Nocardia uniformis]NNH75721.1 helix-turn-helix domain-containing protein [Nocardia uniformis]